MSTASPRLESRKLGYLGATFILLFFLFFSYRGLSAYFTFDDGTTVVAVLKPFETPFWLDLVHILTVFTKAFRPLTTLFWRPLYAIFGFNPLPYRIVVHLLLTVNIGLAYVLARRLEVTREAAALTALVFCYNASTLDLYYNTCLVGDPMCFLFYGLALVIYAGGRQTGDTLSFRSTAAIVVLYLLGLDSKENAVTLPGVLVLYELLYRHGDFRDRKKALRVSALPAVMLVMGAIYLKIKVADMTRNAAYDTHVTLGFIVDNIGHYLEQLLYFPEKSVTPGISALILGALIVAAAVVRSRQAIFGILFFVAALIPVAVIAPRGGYAAYVPYFGLALAAGAILAGFRTQLIRRNDLETTTAVVLFLGVAALLCRAHMVNRMPGTGYYEWTTPRLVSMMNDFRTNIPEFPPGARVLITEDPWEPDWGQMFLVRMMYDDKTVWVDRTKNMDRPPNPSNYDLVVSYQPPEVALLPARIFKFPMQWETRGKATGPGQFQFSSPNAHGAASRIDFAPQAARPGQNVVVTVPGLSNVEVNALYRIVSGKESTTHLVEAWCALDAAGTCKVPAPWGSPPGTMIVDWIQPANQRWMITRGSLTITE